LGGEQPVGNKKPVGIPKLVSPERVTGLGADGITIEKIDPVKITPAFITSSFNKFMKKKGC